MPGHSRPGRAREVNDDIRALSLGGQLERSRTIQHDCQRRGQTGVALLSRPEEGLAISMRPRTSARALFCLACPSGRSQDGFRSDPRALYTTTRVPCAAPEPTGKPEADPAPTAAHLSKNVISHGGATRRGMSRSKPGDRLFLVSEDTIYVPPGYILQHSVAARSRLCFGEGASAAATDISNLTASRSGKPPEVQPGQHKCRIDVLFSPARPWPSV